MNNEIFKKKIQGVGDTLADAFLGGNPGNLVSVEDLYQAFKRRLLSEVKPTDEQGNTGNWEVGNDGE